MYSLVHVEARYVGAFLVLFWCGILFSARVPRMAGGKVMAAITVAIVASLLLPTGWLISRKYARRGGNVNMAALAAAEIDKVGVHPGSQVACICPSGKAGVLGMDRIARLTVAAEVDLDRADEFWSLPIATQQDLLHIFAARGIQAVIATAPRLNAANQSEWTRLGSTQFWVWLPAGH
jgi:hypothetical protein